MTTNAETLVLQSNWWCSQTDTSTWLELSRSWEDILGIRSVGSWISGVRFRKQQRHWASKLGQSKIAGIVVGVCVLAVTAAGILCVIRLKHRQWKDTKSVQESSLLPELPAIRDPAEAPTGHAHELPDSERSPFPGHLLRPKRYLVHIPLTYFDQ